MKPSTKVTGTLVVKPDRTITMRMVPRRIQLTDGALQLVGKGFGQLEQKVPAGVYQVSVESRETPYKQLVLVRPHVRTEVTYKVSEDDQLASATPVPGSESMHEFFREPLDKLTSCPPTARGSRIIVMTTQQQNGPIAWDDITLRSADGRSLKGFGESLLRDPNGSKWAAASADVPPGGYVLEWRESTGEVMRQALWASKGWTTLVFAGIKPEGTLDGDAVSVYLWPLGTSFSPEQKGNADWEQDRTLDSQRCTELALQSLTQGRQLMAFDQINSQLLVNKFHNPMLGILGCHLLLQRSQLNSKLIKEVIGNLKRLVPNHPDVLALQFLAVQKGIKAFPAGKSKLPVLKWPPMLRLGMVAMLNEDWHKSGSIEHGSFLDRIRIRVLSGGVWTRWHKDLAKSEFVDESLISRMKKGSIFKKPTVALRVLERFLITAKKNKFRKVKAEDLRWAGLSRIQANEVIGIFQSHQWPSRGKRTSLKMIDNVNSKHKTRTK